MRKLCFVILLLLLIPAAGFTRRVSVETRYLSYGGYASDEVGVTLSYWTDENEYVSNDYELPVYYRYSPDESAVHITFQRVPSYTQDGPHEFSFHERYQKWGSYLEFLGSSSSYDFQFYGHDTVLFIVYYRGGTYSFSPINSFSNFNTGDVAHFAWLADTGVEQSSRVQIEISRNNGSSWQTIADVPYNHNQTPMDDGTFDWQVTGPISSNCYFRQTLYDYAGNEVTYTSNKFSIIFNCPSQQQITWEKNFNNVGIEIGKTIIQTEDGGYFIAGEDITDIIVNKSRWHWVKIDACGNILWQGETNSFGGNAQCSAENAIELSNGDLVIIGWARPWQGDSLFTDPNSNNMHIVRLNSQGAVLWHQVYNYGYVERGVDIAENYSGGLLALARVSDADMMLVNLYGNGTQNGTPAFFHNSDLNPSSIIKSSGNSYMISGSRGGSIYAIKINSAGNDTVWTKEYPIGYLAIPGNIIECEEGGFALGGSRRNSALYTWYTYYLIRTDYNGNLLWGKYYASDIANAQNSNVTVRAAYDKGFILSGYTGVIGNDPYGYLVRTDRYGIKIWDTLLEVNNVVLPI